MSTTRTWIDLNSDVGESFGNYMLGRPEEVMQGISHANIACGFHAGDPGWVRRSVESAKKYGVTVGGHPGFPDMLGFGRRLMHITPQEGKDYVVYQLGALKAFAEAAGLRLEAAKPHSAFYVWAQLSEENTRAMLEGFQAVNPDIVAYLPALPHYPVLAVAEQLGMRVVKEFYPGLGYKDDGDLTYGHGEDSVEEAVRLVMRVVTEGKVTTTGGKELTIDAESIAISGELMQAPEILRALREALTREGVTIRSALHVANGRS